jgi:hypothetical protein
LNLELSAWQAARATECATENAIEGKTYALRPGR